MKKILITAFLLATAAIPAAAADLPLKAPVNKAPVVSPAYNWSGWYVGGHVGHLWGNTSVWDEGVLIESDAPTNGVIGGLLAGVNWQKGAFVFGIEGDFGWTNAHGTGGDGGGGAVPVTETNLYDFNWTSHVRARVGYAMNNWLLFMAGGIGAGGFRLHADHDGECRYPWWRCLLRLVDRRWRRLCHQPDWVGRIEYLYDDYGDKNYLIGGDPYRVELTGQTLRGAIIFRH